MMRARKVKPETFKEFIDIAPEEIQNIFEKSKTIQQSKNWHPEGNVFIHIGIVFNRAKRIGDINMMLAALFHDLGKVEATKFVNNKWSAHGHEFGSARLVEKYKEWIESLGANFPLVYYIVKNHMRAKQIHEMRRTKREAFMKEEFFPFVDAFSKFDDMQTDYSNDIDE